MLFHYTFLLVLVTVHWIGPVIQVYIRSNKILPGLIVRAQSTRHGFNKGNYRIISRQGIGELNKMKSRTSYAELNPDIYGIGIFGWKLDGRN